VKIDTKVYLIELIDLFMGINTSNLDRQDCRIEVGVFDCAGWNPSAGTVVLRVGSWSCLDE
jgi:hypothetical protein